MLLIASVDDCSLTQLLNLHGNSENQLHNDSEAPIIDALTISAEFQSFIEVKNALDLFQKVNFCQFYIRDSRTCIHRCQYLSAYQSTLDFQLHRMLLLDLRELISVGVGL